MFKHIVCFKLKDSAEGASRAENARQIKSKLEALRGRIPGLQKLEVGINVLQDAAAYDVVLYTEFASPEDANKYQTHPEHVAVSQFIGRVKEARVVVDYHAD
jgi:hypothetical protein